MNRCRGILMIDVIGALVIVSLLIIALTVSMGYHHRAVSSLDDSQEALRLAERALADLQTTGTTSLGGGGTNVKLTPLVTDAPAPRGWQWMRVTVNHRRGSAELTGLTLAQRKEKAP